MSVSLTPGHPTPNTNGRRADSILLAVRRIVMTPAPYESHDEGDLNEPEASLGSVLNRSDPKAEVNDVVLLIPATASQRQQCQKVANQPSQEAGSSSGLRRGKARSSVAP